MSSEFTNPNIVKLNLGCWKRDYPGFINVDLHDYPHVHHRTSVDELSMFEDASVDLMYASHVLEYFSLKQAPRVLREWNRVLKPGGVLRVCVPDFEALTRVYQRSQDVLSIQGSLYATIDPPVILEGQYVHHKAMYDFKLLKSLLEQNGFMSVEKYRWEDFLPEGVTDHSSSTIPRNDFKNGILVSLNLVARKAGGHMKMALMAKHEAVSLKNRIVRKIGRIFRGKFFKERKERYKI